MVYEYTVQGIPVTSNWDATQDVPHGSKYTTDIKFSVPYLSYLATYGLTLPILATNLIAAIKEEGSAISEVDVTAPDEYTLRFSMKCSSPPVLIAVGAVIGLLALLTYLITQCIITITAPFAPITNSPL